MLRYIEVPVFDSGADDFSVYDKELNPYEASYTKLTIEVNSKIMEEVYEAYTDFRVKRYNNPGRLVLGWKTWVQLSYADSDFKDPGARIETWQGVPISVDDSTPDWVQFLPELQHIHMGGLDLGK